MLLLKQLPSPVPQEYFFINEIGQLLPVARRFAAALNLSRDGSEFLALNAVAAYSFLFVLWCLWEIKIHQVAVYSAFPGNASASSKR